MNIEYMKNKKKNKNNICILIENYPENSVQFNFFCLASNHYITSHITCFFSPVHIQENLEDDIVKEALNKVNTYIYIYTR